MTEISTFYHWGIIGIITGILGVSTIQNGEINWVLVLILCSILLISYEKDEKGN